MTAKHDFICYTNNLHLEAHHLWETQVMRSIVNSIERGCEHGGAREGLIAPALTAAKVEVRNLVMSLTPTNKVPEFMRSDPATLRAAAIP